MWFKVDSNGSHPQLRLTITKDTNNTTGVVSISSIKLLTSRWGDQGQGSELEHPYQWTETGSLMSISAGNCDLGSTSNYWKNGYFTNINGVAVGSSPKFTDTTYSAATSSNLGLVKVGSNITNSSGTISLTKANVTSALGYTPPTTNTTYGVVSTTANGLAPKRDGSTSHFLRGDGTWAAPTGAPLASASTNGLMSSSNYKAINTYGGVFTSGFISKWKTKTGWTES